MNKPPREDFDSKGELPIELDQALLDGLANRARDFVRRARALDADSGDLALTALRTFLRHWRLGQYRDKKSRDEFLPLLFGILYKKFLTKLKRQQADKRGGGKVAQLSDSDSASSRELGPEELALWNDELAQIQSRLDSPADKVLVELLQGFDRNEIAARMDISIRTVDRIVRRIKDQAIALA